MTTVSVAAAALFIASGVILALRTWQVEVAAEEAGRSAERKSECHWPATCQRGLAGEVTGLPRPALDRSARGLSFDDRPPGLDPPHDP